MTDTKQLEEQLDELFALYGLREKFRDVQPDSGKVVADNFYKALLRLIAATKTTARIDEVHLFTGTLAQIGRLNKDVLDYQESRIKRLQNQTGGSDENEKH